MSPLFVSDGVTLDYTVYNRRMQTNHICRNLSVKQSLFLLLLAATLLLPAISACGNDEDRRVLVYAAASLRDVLTELAQQYETSNNVHIAFNWGGSTALASQLKRHAPGDVFISAGSGPMDNLEEAGLLASASRTTLASNSLVLVVSSDAEATFDSPKQTLLGSSLVSVADPGLSPAGRYAQEFLESMALWNELQERIVLGANVRTALAYVESGAAEAGVVYRTDALNNEGVRIAHEVPPDLHTPIFYPAAVLKESRNQAEGSLFLSYLIEDSSQARFRAYGFLVGDPP